jgi:NAD(P)-dependent dehydrogenase (short-subunit alcohol dehydrogenase family)
MANSKDVVVTGVSTGIGWGTTKVLVSKGFRVFGSVRKQADADRLQREFGNGFVPLMMDVTAFKRHTTRSSTVLAAKAAIFGPCNSSADSPGC